MGFDADAITEAQTLSEAIRIATENAATGDNVLSRLRVLVLTNFLISKNADDFLKTESWS